MKAWQPLQIKDLGRVVTGKTPPTESAEYFDGDELFVSPKDLTRNSYYVGSTATRISEKALEKFKGQLIPRDAVMFTSLSFAFGKMGIASKSCITNQQINSVVVNATHCARFVYYLLRTYEPYIFAYNSGIDTPIVPKSVFEKIPVVVPAKITQKKIAALLSAYDDLIANNQRRIDLLESIAEEIYREWFVRMRFPGHATAEHDKGMPLGWQPKTAAEMVDVLGGGTPSTEVSHYWDGDIPFFSPKDSHDGAYCLKTEQYITDLGLENCSSRLFPAGTIFITARGTVGNIVISGVPMAMNQSCYALVPKLEEKPFFVFAGLMCAVSVIKGVANSGVFDNVVMDTFKIIPLIDPGSELRAKYIDVVEPIYTESLLLRGANQKLIAMRDALLPRLISGQLCVDQLDIQYPSSMMAEFEQPA
jgi:type I restriction enzyme S subunit